MSDPRFDPVPDDPAKRLDRLAHDLAWGVWNNKWRNVFNLQGIPAWGELRFARRMNTTELQEYLAKAWDNQPPNPAQLVDLGILTEVPGGIRGNDTASYRLSRNGLELARTAKPGPIFISYRRSESTAFAMLIADRLKANRLVPFLDDQPDREDQGVALKPGGKWRPDLEEAIESREYVIVLVAPSTLRSTAVCQEIQWALVYRRNIIPIWHRGFDLNNVDHFPPDLDPTIRETIADTNAITVIAEAPHQYEVAIERLLSVFGIAY